jgi:pimeloyl-ACP methyl ester carboxylesterase
MPRSALVDGFRLAYDHTVAGQPDDADDGPDGGARPAALLLHGWPGDREDLAEVATRLAGTADVVRPDLRGFGRSDKHPADPAAQYGPQAQVRSLVGLLDELGLRRVVAAGYDVGSRVAQALALAHPDRVAALVVTPPVPGVGGRILGPGPFREFWYQAFHQLELAEELLDGRPDAVRAYLRHFWTHWSGPAFTPTDAHLDRLVQVYGPPGAFVASVGWYRAGAAVVAQALDERPPAPEHRVAVPTTVLWPGHDPLFPREWADRLSDFFADVRLVDVPDVGHFVPLEAPDVFASAVTEAIRSTTG